MANQRYTYQSSLRHDDEHSKTVFWSALGQHPFRKQAQGLNSIVPHTWAESVFPGSQMRRFYCMSTFERYYDSKGERQGRTVRSSSKGLQRVTLAERTGILDDFVYQLNFQDKFSYSQAITFIYLCHRSDAFRNRILRIIIRISCQYNFSKKCLGRLLLFKDVVTAMGVTVEKINIDIASPVAEFTNVFRSRYCHFSFPAFHFDQNLLFQCRLSQPDSLRLEKQTVRAYKLLHTYKYGQFRYEGTLAQQPLINLYSILKADREAKKFKNRSMFLSLSLNPSFHHDMLGDMIDLLEIPISNTGKRVEKLIEAYVTKEGFGQREKQDSCYEVIPGEDPYFIHYNHLREEIFQALTLPATFFAASSEVSQTWHPHLLSQGMSMILEHKILSNNRELALYLYGAWTDFIKVQIQRLDQEQRIKIQELEEEERAARFRAKRK